jgi:hypothetical protein
MKVFNAAAGLLFDFYAIKKGDGTSKLSLLSAREVSLTAVWCWEHRPAREIAPQKSLALPRFGCLSVLAN